MYSCSDDPIQRRQVAMELDVQFIKNRLPDSASVNRYYPHAHRLRELGKFTPAHP
jgi:hypothetical protein